MINLLIVLVFLDYISIKIINNIGILDYISIKIINNIGIIDYRIIELFSIC